MCLLLSSLPMYEIGFRQYMCGEVLFRSGFLPIFHTSSELRKFADATQNTFKFLSATQFIEDVLLREWSTVNIFLKFDLKTTSAFSALLFGKHLFY